MEHTLFNLPGELLLFFIGSIAGFVNIFAGGGSTLTLPALMFMGLDASMANGTNRIVIFLQNVSGVSSFHNQKMRGLRVGLKYALFTVPGAIAGAFYSINITQVWFERILAVIMIGVIITLFYKPKVGRTNEEEKPGIGFYISLILLGFYGGFIQVGIGFIIIGMLAHFLKVKLAQVNFYKLILVLVYTLPVIIFFVLNEKVHWGYGLSTAAGSMSGAWIAARLNVSKGDKLIRYVLAFSIFLIAIKLFIN